MSRMKRAATLWTTNERGPSDRRYKSAGTNVALHRGRGRARGVLYGVKIVRQIEGFFVIRRLSLVNSTAIDTISGEVRLDSIIFMISPNCFFWVILAPARPAGFIKALSQNKTSNKQELRRVLR